MMSRSFVLSLTLALASSQSIAQKYTTAAGLRIGSGIGFTVQQHVFNKLTIEGTLQQNLFKSGTNVAVLAEHHYPIAFKGFNFYVGGGPHAEFKPDTRVYDDKGNSYTIHNNAYGVSGVAGIEMRLKNLLLSYDYQPGVNIHGGDHIFSSRTGLSVRYILIKSAKKEKDWMFWKKWQK
jgi:hypothetical protein